MTVAILGASDKPDRYSYKAQTQLTDHGHHVIPIRPAGGQLQGIEALTSITDVEQPLDVLTVYVNPKRLEPLVNDIIAAAPQRIILNPGTESKSATDAFESAGILVEEACTLVLLATGEF